MRAFASGGQYDVCVIGGGPGGYVAAIKAAQRGLKTVCVEKRGTLGGTCLNVGCIPSKALLNSTHKYHEAQHQFKSIGIEVSDVKMNFPQLMKSKEKAVTGLTGGIEYLFKKNKVDYKKGWGKFSGENSVAIDMNDGKKEELSAKNIIIATGSEPSSLPKGMLDIDEQYVVTSTGALDLKKIPGSMVVIGGGVIGLELGSVYARLGTKVDVVEFAPTICPTLDKEVSSQFSKLLKKQGMNIMTSTKLVSGKNNKEKGVELVIENAKGQQNMKADVVLLCVGRRPYTDGLDLGKAGLEANKFGRVEINDHWQTKKSHIYAIGDVVDGPMLAHKAEEEGIAAVEHILGEGGHVNYGAIPGVIYTHPEVANVGLSEEELKEKKIEYVKGVFPF